MVDTILYYLLIIDVTITFSTMMPKTCEVCHSNIIILTHVMRIQTVIGKFDIVTNFGGQVLSVNKRIRKGE